MRAGEVRSLRSLTWTWAFGRVRVVGKGNKERVVPVDGVFFTEVAAYLRAERPAGVRHAGVFRGAAGPDPRPGDDRGRDAQDLPDPPGIGPARVRVRPHRLRHTYGTELAAAGIDLLVLRELMGHASPETTARYVHLSSDTLAAEFAAARAVTDR